MVGNNPYTGSLHSFLCKLAMCLKKTKHCASEHAYHAYPDISNGGCCRLLLVTILCRLNSRFRTKFGREKNVIWSFCRWVYFVNYNLSGMGSAWILPITFKIPVDIERIHSANHLRVPSQALPRKKSVPGSTNICRKGGVFSQSFDIDISFGPLVLLVVSLFRFSFSNRRTWKQWMKNDEKWLIRLLHVWRQIISTFRSKWFFINFLSLGFEYKHPMSDAKSYQRERERERWWITTWVSWKCMGHSASLTPSPTIIDFNICYLFYTIFNFTMDNMCCDAYFSFSPSVFAAKLFFYDPSWKSIV